MIERFKEKKGTRSNYDAVVVCSPQGKDAQKKKG
jgi:hypothetical protein